MMVSGTLGGGGGIVLAEGLHYWREAGRDSFGLFSGICLNLRNSTEILSQST
jgi:hypothetical protein